MTDIFHWSLVVLSTTGIVLNIHHRSECFIIWLFTNVSWCYVDAMHGIYSQSVQFSINACLSVYGIYQWRSEGNLMPKSDLELQFESLLKLTRIPDPVREYRFHPVRRWRFDFAWPDRMVAVEIEGGTFSRGKSRHTTGAGHQADCVKYNAAALGGWTVLKYTAKDLKSRPVQVLDEVTQALG